MSDLENIKTSVQNWLKNPDLQIDVGLCLQMQDNVEGDGYFARIYMGHEFLELNYPEYSGNELFPVPSPDPSKCAQLFYEDAVNYLSGDYGQSRFNLLKVLQSAKVAVYLDPIDEEYVVEFHNR